ncbi:coiled-coil domain-containing protein 130 homolog [Tubulanus polymorphus]|uniref:coiled-coil domain-containing protein 130 homolog n=1 Tax=Tubulanus polymorphus TaxID=672921 RepID=UPI003DA62210
MGERKGVNKYYPPDFDPKKHYSLNGYHGTHALRERARKIDQGIIIIRFEMPYNIWCEGCGIHIAMGVRYNAEKTKAGMYYTTPIYKFNMKCHFCDTHFEIQTDPQNSDYVILSGARRKEQRWDPAENEQIVTDDRSKIKKLATDPMYKLEHGSEDKTKIKNAVPALAQISDIKSVYKDDYMLNKLARQKFRGEKTSIKNAQTTDQLLLDKSSLNIKLVKEHEDDKKLAHLLTYKTAESYDQKEKRKRAVITNSSIFSKPNTKISNVSQVWNPTPTKHKTTDDLDSDVVTKKLKYGIVKKCSSVIKNTEEISENNSTVVSLAPPVQTIVSSAAPAQLAGTSAPPAQSTGTSPPPIQSAPAQSTGGLVSLISYESSSDTDSST